MEEHWKPLPQSVQRAFAIGGRVGSAVGPAVGAPLGAPLAPGAPLASAAAVGLAEGGMKDSHAVTTRRVATSASRIGERRIRSCEAMRRGRIVVDALSAT